MRQEQEEGKEGKESRQQSEGRPMTISQAFPGSRMLSRRCLAMVALMLVLTGVMAVGGASPAAAMREPKPLKITKFTQQSTEPVKVAGPLTGESWGFENRPVLFTQAGGHPPALTTTIDFETEEVLSEAAREGKTHPGQEYFTTPTRDPKDIVVDLPPGLLGDPLALPRCPLKQALSTTPCPASSQVGVVLVHFAKGAAFLGPIVNVVPEAGQSAEFALEDSSHISTLLTAHLVRTAQGYGFDVASNAILEDNIASVETTFWGVPADAVNDPERGLFCEIPSGVGSIWSCGLGTFSTISGLGGEKAGVTPAPFLVWPSDCAVGAERAVMRADSWEEPGHVGVNGNYEGYVEAETTLPGVSGCDLLGFNAGTGIAVEPDTLLADEPVGLGVSLHVPLNEQPGTNAAPLLRDTRVTLPEGMSVSPGVVDGVQACEAEGPEGINITGPESEQAGPNGELQLAPGHCPDASVLGTAEAITPFLPVPVKGHVYLARPGCGGAGQAPCTEQDALDGNLYKLYLEIGGEGALASQGIVFKVPLEAQANPATGQLTAVARDLVQAPYSEVSIHLNGGPRAPIDNPAVCGPAVTTADFTPWSASGLTPEGSLVSGTPDALSSSFFEVEPQDCPNHPGFSPGFVAGTVTPNAGKFSAFTMNLSRQDREQYIKGIQLHTPPGLLAMLSSVPLCGEPEADTGHCPEASKIGTTRVASGAGSHPFEIEGTVYLTGPYGGAPFGLSIVTPAVAGPFNLGLVVVRARINIDPVDATATITLDETGPYAIPQIVDGVPLRLKRVTADIDRPGFMFNPTNCDPEQVTAVISGSEEAKANVSSPLAVGGCQSLAFKPSFTVSTSGKTSRADGASLDAKLSFPAGSAGSEANIARVKVDLPKQLPSRLTTLQKACTAQVFESNPANCPAASIIGIVKVNTPLLPVQLMGPAYFVSHGGEAFPSLIMVLQGDGVRVDVVGATFISKAGITSSTLKTVPDVPFSSFELYLPEGKYSALAADGNLCTSKLTMPTAFVAQNGAEIHETTKIAVTGCAKAKKAQKKKKKSKSRAKKADRASHERTR
jgi:hypothetical protein